MNEIAPANAYTAKEGRIIDGNVRVPGWTFQDVRRNDPNPGPDDVYGEFTDIGDKFSVPNSWYFSEEIAKLEHEKLWSNSWIFACRVEKIPDVGSCYVHNFLDHSVLVVRSAKNEIKAFRNTCRHRGNALRPQGSCGIINKFWCPFHGATWHLDGSIKSWPYEYDFPHLKEEDYGLSKVHLAEFKGFLFVNMAEDPVPFEEFIDPLPHLTANITAENWNPVAHMRRTLACNWKLARQAFQEAIHAPVVHPQALDVALAGGTQIDVPGKFIRRLIQPSMVPTDQRDEVKSEKELVAAMMSMRGMEPDQDLIDSFGDDVRARNFMADGMIQEIKGKSGIDVSNRATCEIVDNIVYYLFPSFHMNVSASAPFCMFVTPTPNPNECYFDMIWFEESLPGTEKPPHPERVDVPMGQTWAENAPDGIPGAVGANVLDQDTDNMEGQQQGLRASPDGTSIFANYGESMIISDMKLLQEILEI